MPPLALAPAMRRRRVHALVVGGSTMSGVWLFVPLLLMLVGMTARPMSRPSERRPGWVGTETLIALAIALFTYLALFVFPYLIALWYVVLCPLQILT